MAFPQSIVIIYTDIALWSVSCFILLILVVLDLILLSKKIYLQKIADKLASTQSIDISSNSNSNTTTPSTSKLDSSPTTVQRINFKMLILPIFMEIFYITTGIIAICFKLEIGVFEGCKPCIQIFFYTLSKMTLYLLFIYRLHIVYTGSIFQYKTTILIAMTVVCILFMIVMSFADLLTVQHTTVIISHKVFCSCIPTLPVLNVSVFLFDIFMGVLCCYLFVRPLNACTLTKRDDEIYKAVMKFMTLTVVAVTSSFLTICVIIVSPLKGFIAVDAVVNCVCIFLWKRRYINIYNNLCCGAEKVIYTMVHRCCSKK